MAMGKQVINPRRLSFKKKEWQVSQLESESTHGEGKPGLQASLTLMKKIKQKGFLCLHRYFICQLSSVQPYTRKPNQALTQVVEKWRSVKEEKPKPYIYAIKSWKPRYQNCGICRNISRTLYITATHTKMACMSSPPSLLISSMSQFGAVALLNQRWQVHVRYVDVHYQLREVIDGERYAALRNAILVRINVSSGRSRFKKERKRRQYLKSSSSRNELMSSCADGLLEPSIILVRMLEMTCGL